MPAAQTPPPPATIRAAPREAVTGVQLAQGIGVQAARGFWADAWAQVLKRPAAVGAMVWLGVVAFFAVVAPFIASGHPLVLREIATGAATSPFLGQLRSPDILLVVGAALALSWIFFGGKTGRAARLGACIVGALLSALVVLPASVIQGLTAQRDVSGWVRWVKNAPSAYLLVPLLLAAVVFGIGMLLPFIHCRPRRAAVTLAACAVSMFAVAMTWDRPLEVFSYIPRETAGQVQATYTLIPFSPSERFTALDRREPLTKLGPALGLPPESAPYHRRFLLGTDAFGQDVLAQLLHACRVSISIGLVSTGIATLIGVTMGALMGYFGGLVDLLLFRIVEVFMAVPLLFLLIVAAAVLPPEMRSTYTMMVIIGCFTWTGAARFTRAEFLKLRGQDFVQAAAATGLPLRSILFKHMLPNGVTPVLVDASFGIAAAISIEATLSFLGLGPIDQASWGKLLSSATNAEGQFKWWLAVFPGAAIFLTVLSYNMIGESLRDAIDPKLKKARV